MLKKISNFIPIFFIGIFLFILGFKELEKKRELETANFTLGLKENSVTTFTLNGESVNWILLEMFEELGIKKTKIIESDDDIQALINKKIVDGVGLTFSDSTLNKNLVFSKPIFNNNLYISSDFLPLTSTKDIQNKVIYVAKKDLIYLPYLHNYLKINLINAEVKLVDSVFQHTNEYFLNTEFSDIWAQNRLFVSFLPPFTIGVSKNFKHLIPKINKLLDNGYRSKINSFIKKKYIFLEHQIFMKKLTKEEKNFLKNIDFAQTSIESNILGFYSKKEKKYFGIVPLYLEKMSNILGIDIKVNSNSKSSEKVIDFSTISNSKNKENTPITFITLNFFSALNPKNDIIGFVNSDISLETLINTFPGFKYKQYTNHKELIKDFNSEKVGHIIFLEYPVIAKNVRISTIKEIKKIPVTFEFKEKDFMLKNIFDKASPIVINSNKEELSNIYKYGQNIYLQNTISLSYYKTITIIVLAILFFIVFIIFIFKLFEERKLKLQIKYDALTGLQTRYVFDELCRNNDNSTGLIIVLDLDKFKFVNDKYGHQTGDKVLIAVANLLVHCLGKKNCYRISGDEFYIFDKNSNSTTKIKRFFKHAKSSSDLTFYGVTISLGYIFKPKGMSMKKAFSLADSAMYEAKKISGFSMKEFDKKTPKI